MFAIVGIYPDDQGIGQRFYDFTLVVDYICPMIYPSHFTASPLGMKTIGRYEPPRTCWWNEWGKKP